jgi:hypothetical protein
MKKLIITFLSIILIGGCIHTFVVEDVKDFKQENDSLRNHIVGLESHIKFLSDELELKEEEISFWGQKYDSCRISK